MSSTVVVTGAIGVNGRCRAAGPPAAAAAGASRRASHRDRGQHRRRSAPTTARRLRALRGDVAEVRGCRWCSARARARVPAAEVTGHGAAVGVRVAGHGQQGAGRARGRARAGRRAKRPGGSLRRSSGRTGRLSSSGWPPEDRRIDVGSTSAGPWRSRCAISVRALDRCWRRARARRWSVTGTSGRRTAGRTASAKASPPPPGGRSRARTPRPRARARRR